MTTYKGFNGFNVTTYAADPVATAAWTTGGALNTGRNNTGGVGTATAAAVAGGADDPAGYTNTTEEYDGTSWTEVTNYPASRTYIGTAGSQTAGLFIAGGSPPTGDCFKYDGTTYTSTGSLGTVVKQGAATGIQTLALYCGGETPPLTDMTEEFNGSTWSSGTAMNTPRNNNICFGVQTDAVTVGGSAPDGPNTWKAEEYNGSAWTVGNILNTGREFGGGPGAGTASTAGMVAAGSSPTISGTYSNEAESYNGTTWSVKSATLTQKRGGASGTRAPTTAYLMTGGTPGYLTSTETYSENSEPNTFLNEGDVWYNSTSYALKFFDGTDIKTVTTS